MEIEWLKVRVAPELREQYVQKDAEIWTTFLSKYPGFLNKEVWISPDNLAEVILVIHWASLDDWKAIPAVELERVEAQFKQAMGNTYTIVESARYQVRKQFPAQD
ncbi:TIGR03792 family protein [Leptolyngbya sp. 7M]|uniref:TIGR03792 family protein n=1 Tax=Leptolyngbya sp. 7M TaxID=2812896 RepID=UPI001B8CDC02|nr:TIGR03792 family protein [Leptolyngbya sp. 7M]QYO67785.1 TIGR03792 family protein [Leptolyngbya sp. 7M]